MQKSVLYVSTVRAVTSVLKAQEPLSHDNVFPIYIYLYVSDQSVFFGSELMGRSTANNYVFKDGLSDLGLNLPLAFLAIFNIHAIE